MYENVNIDTGKKEPTDFIYLSALCLNPLPDKLSKIILYSVLIQNKVNLSAQAHTHFPTLL